MTLIQLLMRSTISQTDSYTVSEEVHLIATSTKTLLKVEPKLMGEAAIALHLGVGTLDRSDVGALRGVDTSSLMLSCTQGMSV